MSTTIFISSVQKEFSTERRALKDFILGDPLLRRFFDVFLFEDLPASDRLAEDVYLEGVDRCTIYIGLFGKEYGIENADGLSSTEREFDRATERYKTRLIYIKGDEKVDRHPKMAALIDKAGPQLIRRRFDGPSGLTTAVYASLVDLLEATGGLRTRPFDASACPDATIQDISEENVRWFLGRARNERKFALDQNTPVEQVLTHLNLLDRSLPTHTAVLLFGREPQRFLLTSEVKCMHFHGTMVQKPIPSYQVFKGTLFTLVDQALDFVMSKIARSVGTRVNGPEAPVTYELPREAVSEAIVNAIVHRDYASNASIQVMLFVDRLEVWNPGQLPTTLTIGDLRKPHASIPHNPLICEPMFLARYVEKAGSGILDMIDLCMKAGLRTPDFRQDGGQFVQTIWRPKPKAQEVQEGAQSGVQLGVQLGSRPESQPESRPESLDRKVLSALQSQILGKSEISAILGQKKVSGQLNKVIRSLLSQGLVEYTIPDKPMSRLQKYRLTDKGREAVIKRFED